MESINPQITELHASYCIAMNMELPMTMLWERYWYDALQEGVTARMVEDVIKERRKRIKAGVRMQESLYLRNLIGDEAKIGDLLNEGHEIAARTRMKVVDACKGSVLKASGRPEWYENREQVVAPQEQNTSRPVSELISDLRKAAI